jgi:hypothetical protein
MDWLPAVMEILRAELPSTEVVIHSQDSPDLAAGLTHGKDRPRLLASGKTGARSEIQAVAKGPVDRRDAARPRFGCSELHSPAEHRGPDVYRSVPGPGTDAVGCYQRLRQALRRETRPSGREPGNGDFAGGVHRRHRPVSALFAKSVAKNRRQPTDTRRTANGRPGHRL